MHAILVDQLQHCGRGGIASAIARLHQSGVATISGLESGANVVKQVLDQVLTIQEALPSKDLLLLEISLARKFLHRLRAAAAVPNQDASRSAACIQAVLSRESDQLLYEPLQLLCPTEGRAHIAVANELPLQVGEQGAALIARQT